MKAGDDLSGLPGPVYRYVKHVLAENQCPIRVMRMAQRGELRTDLHHERWMKFRAKHVVMPYSRSFTWDAYRRHQGILVPSRGEVGWYAKGRLEIVWRGEITSLEYQLERV